MVCCICTPAISSHSPLLQMCQFFAPARQPRLPQLPHVQRPGNRKLKIGFVAAPFGSRPEQNQIECFHQTFGTCLGTLMRPHPCNIPPIGFLGMLKKGFLDPPLSLVKILQPLFLNASILQHFHGVGANPLRSFE